MSAAVGYPYAKFRTHWLTAWRWASQIDDEHDGSLLLDIARSHNLTVYDAAYLEVAVRRSLPLATLDQRLSKAADAIGVSTI